MSAPDTNTETQERQHRGPLWGIWGALAVVAILLVWWLASALSGEEPDPGQAAAPAEAAEQAQTPPASD